jgi:hypothetical protein
MKNFTTYFLMFSLTTIIVLGNAGELFAQKLIIMDGENDNKIVNDSTITIYSSDQSINQLTALFFIKNTTDVPLTVYLRKKVNQINDSTTDYFCYYIKCWPGTDTTDVADTIPAGTEDHSFATHVTHVRRFDYPQPLLPPGLSSITYTLFDNTTFAEPVEASVTVIYHLSPLAINEQPSIKAEVYPNPATDFICVKTDRQIPGKYKVVIYNSLGALVKREEIMNSSNSLTIKTNDLPQGVYTGLLTSESNTHTSFRFVVQGR